MAKPKFADLKVVDESDIKKAMEVRTIRSTEEKLSTMFIDASQLLFTVKEIQTTDSEKLLKEYVQKLKILLKAVDDSDKGIIAQIQDLALKAFIKATEDCRKLISEDADDLVIAKKLLESIMENHHEDLSLESICLIIILSVKDSNQVEGIKGIGKFLHILNLSPLIQGYILCFQTTKATIEKIMCDEFDSVFKKAQDFLEGPSEEEVSKQLKNIQLLNPSFHSKQSLYDLFSNYDTQELKKFIDAPNVEKLKEAELRWKRIKECTLPADIQSFFKLKLDPKKEFRDLLISLIRHYQDTLLKDTGEKTFLNEGNVLKLIQFVRENYKEEAALSDNDEVEIKNGIHKKFVKKKEDMLLEMVNDAYKKLIETVKLPNKEKMKIAMTEYILKVRAFSEALKKDSIDKIVFQDPCLNVYIRATRDCVQLLLKEDSELFESAKNFMVFLLKELIKNSVEVNGYEDQILFIILAKCGVEEVKSIEGIAAHFLKFSLDELDTFLRKYKEATEALSPLLTAEFDRIMLDLSKSFEIPSNEILNSFQEQLKLVQSFVPAYRQNQSAKAIISNNDFVALEPFFNNPTEEMIKEAEIHWERLRRFESSKLIKTIFKLNTAPDLSQPTPQLQSSLSFAEHIASLIDHYACLLEKNEQEKAFLKEGNAIKLIRLLDKLYPKTLNVEVIKKLGKCKAQYLLRYIPLLFKYFNTEKYVAFIKGLVESVGELLEFSNGVGASIKDTFTTEPCISIPMTAAEEWAAIPKDDDTDIIRAQKFLRLLLSKFIKYEGTEESVFEPAFNLFKLMLLTDIEGINGIKGAGMFFRKVLANVKDNNEVNISSLKTALMELIELRDIWGNYYHNIWKDRLVPAPGYLFYKQFLLSEKDDIKVISTSLSEEKTDASKIGNAKVQAIAKDLMSKLKTKEDQ